MQKLTRDQAELPPLSIMDLAQELCRACDELASLCSTRDRERAETEARWAANQAAYFARRDAAAKQFLESSVGGCI